MIPEKLKSFVIQCTRVWHLLRKPTPGEFKKISLVSSVGLGLIGMIGFIIAILLGFLWALA